MELPWLMFSEDKEEVHMKVVEVEPWPQRVERVEVVAA